MLLQNIRVQYKDDTLFPPGLTAQRNGSYFYRKFKSHWWAGPISLYSPSLSREYVQSFLLQLLDMSNSDIRELQ